MASENSSLRLGLADALSAQAGKPYEVLYVPEEGWLKVREEYIRNHDLGKQETPGEQSTEERVTEEIMDFVQEAEQENADPLITEAEEDFR